MKVALNLNYFLSIRRNPKEVDLGYMAGFLDADGCIYVRFRKKTRTVNISVGIEQDTVEPLKLFQAYFPGSLRETKNKTKDGKFKFRYQVSSKRAEDLIKKLSPYLIKKRPQAELALRIRGSSSLNEKVVLGRKLSRKNSHKRGTPKILSTSVSQLLN